MTTATAQNDLFSTFSEPAEFTPTEFTPTEFTPAKKVTLTDEMREDFAISGKTSMFRESVSAPVKVLIEKGLFSQGSALNYGKGRFDFDTDAIKETTGMCIGYDYVYLPDVQVLGSSYDYVIANYVTNTLPRQARRFVWQQISDCTKGIAFVNSRTDKVPGTPFEDGFRTKANTFQKRYKPKELLLEASEYFEFTMEIRGKAGYSIIACSHQPLPEHFLAHKKK